MNTLALICMTIIHLVKQVLLFPQTLALAHKQRRRRTEISEDEVERLDRLRNPSKYLGK